MRRSSRLELQGIVGLLACATALSTACSDPRTDVTAKEREQARAEAKALVDEGYHLKTRGANKAALAKFAAACELLGRAVGAETQEVASCLDDQASVHVRIGDYDLAELLYYRALRTAGGVEGTDPLLVSGIRYRIGLLGRLEQLGVRCAEPEEQPADAPLPYFPAIVEMQRALGALGPGVHSCAAGPPRAVTLKVTVTGDGKPVMAEARGAEAGTQVGNCVENRIVEALHTAELPRFGACFRAFTYPFPVGDVRPSEPTPPPSV